jgi:hypothetical protein
MSLKTAEEIAEALCRWFTPDNEPIELTDVAHTREVVARCYADALRHAADLCAKVSPRCGELKDKAIRDCIKIIYAEADKLTP